VSPRSSQGLWLSTEEFVLPSSSWRLIVKTNCPWWQLGRIRVERDPTLCELLNEDLGNLCGWPNFTNKSCVSICLFLFNFCCIFVFFVFLSSRPRVS
jgi:hypothetical protein